MKSVIGFVLGATAGTLVTWKLLEKKYKDLANEEIEAVREYYRSRSGEVSTMKNADSISYSQITTENSVGKEAKEDYKERVEDLEYTVQVENGDEGIAPYTISPDEFGDAPGFDTKSWKYYADSTLTDENGEIVGDPESIIGDALTRFGEYEDDSVYVRNENNECDYEILLHDQTFEEMKSKPYYGTDY